MTVNRRIISLIIGALATLVSCWILFKSVLPGQIIGAMRGLDYRWLIASLLFGFLAMCFQAMRWRVLISPLKTVSLGKVFSATSIGLMINNILPLRLGEYARALALSHRDSGLPISPLLATVLIERLLFDLGCLALIVLTVLFFVPFHRDIEFGLTGVIAIMLCVVVLASAVTIMIAPRVITRAGHTLLRLVSTGRRPLMENSIHRFAEMVVLMRSRTTMIKGFILTGVIWLCMASSIYCLFLAFSFHLPLTAAFVLLAAVVLAMIVPSLPGYFGVFHLAAVIALSTFNIGGADARAFSIVLHLSQYIPTTAIGLIFLYGLGFSLGRIRRGIEAVEPADP